jgi:glycosyltransferase involved in cell wall biosynthesis
MAADEVGGSAGRRMSTWRLRRGDRSPDPGAVPAPDAPSDAPGNGSGSGDAGPEALDRMVPASAPGPTDGSPDQSSARPPDRPADPDPDPAPAADAARPPVERVHVFAELPDSPTRALVAALRGAGVPVRAVYRTALVAQEHAWAATLEDDDVVADSPWRERQEWRAARDAHVLLLGRPLTAFDVARRTALGRRSRTLHVWGRRLASDRFAVHAVRRAYLAAHGLDGVLAVGSRAADSYRSLTPRSVPVHVLPQVTARGLDVPPRPALRPTVGYAGQLAADRGVDLLLRSLARLSASARPRLQVAGSGPQAAALRTRARRLGIHRWVDWLGELDPEALGEARSRWWAQVVPAPHRDGWSLAVQEALNAGVPVIAAARAPSAADLVRSGENGVIVAGEDPERWAGAIGELLGAERHRAAALRARAVGAAFAPDRAAAWLLDLLAEAEAAREAGDRLAPRSFVEQAWTDVGQAVTRPHG